MLCYVIFVVEAETLKTGKSVAFLRVLVKDQETQKLVATGEHVKYVG